MSYLRNRFLRAAVLLMAVPFSAVAQIDPSLSSLAEQTRVDVLRATTIQPMTPCFAGSVGCAQTVTGRVSVDSCQTSSNVYGLGYEFNGTFGQRVTLRSSSPSFRMSIGLFDGRSGNSTLYASVQATANGQTAEISSFSLPYTGPYLIILSPLVPVTFGDYSLTVTCASAPSASCFESSTNLCLNGGRFKVEANWQTNDGQSGAGRAVRLTSDTGYFWFFGESNVEVVVKALDACSLSNRHWVFAAGLTNVRVTLIVTDTKTGAVRTYFNPLNTPFQPIQDTSAFATCP